MKGGNSMSNALTAMAAAVFTSPPRPITLALLFWGRPRPKWNSSIRSWREISVALCPISLRVQPIEDGPVRRKTRNG